MATIYAEQTKIVETVFSRDASITETIKRLIKGTEFSIDAALYSFSSGELVRTLLDAQERGIEFRLLTDWSKYEQNPVTRKLFTEAGFKHRLLRGRNGSNSKMHHKFVVLDRSVVLTGSYNWTLASETRHFENIVILRDADSVRDYKAEFDSLWDNGDRPLFAS